MSPRKKQLRTATAHLERAQRLAERWRDSYPETEKAHRPEADGQKERERAAG